MAEGISCGLAQERDKTNKENFAIAPIGPVAPIALIAPIAHVASIVPIDFETVFLFFIWMGRSVCLVFFGPSDGIVVYLFLFCLSEGPLVCQKC